MHRRFLDQKVMLLFGGDRLLKPGNETEYEYRFYDHFAIYPRIWVISHKMEYKASKGSGRVTIPVKISRNPYTAGELAVSNPFLTYEVFDTIGDRIQYGEPLRKIADLSGKTEWTFVTLKIPSGSMDHCFIRFGVASGTLPPTLNSGNIRVDVIE